MAETPATNGGKLWSSKKVQIVLIGVVAVLALTLGGAELGITDDQTDKAVSAVKWLVGFLLGGHTATDVAAIAANALKPSTIEEDTDAENE